MSQLTVLLWSIGVIIFYWSIQGRLAVWSRSDSGIEFHFLGWIITIVLVLINIGIAIGKAFIV